MRSRGALHELLELAVRRLGDVEERSERTGRKQRVTDAPQQSHVAVAGAEASKKRGLSDAGLSSDEQNAPARAAFDSLEPLAEHHQLVAALEELASVRNDGGVISGVHALIFADDAPATRAFLRDVLGFPYVDNGDGWLIFALPPTELAIHPGPGWSGQVGQHELFLMCHDIERTVDELKTKGVEFEGPISDQGFGLLTSLKVPGGAGTIGLYQPKHASPLDEFAGN